MKRTATLTLAALAILALAGPVLAYPSYFTNNCASCHTNDTATCNGCHHHGPVGLNAHADAASYTPGADVTVTLDGGSQDGWIRGILYDESDLVVALATGPTGAGDDSQAGAIGFPVELVAPAPAGSGPHVWQAARFGGLENGSGHTETRVDVTINVEATPVAGTSWSAINNLY